MRGDELMEASWSASPARIGIPYSASAGANYNATVSWTKPSSEYTVSSVKLCFGTTYTGYNVYTTHIENGRWQTLGTYTNQGASAGSIEIELPASAYTTVGAGQSDTVTLRFHRPDNNLQIYDNIRLVVTYTANTAESTVTVSQPTAGSAQTVTCVNADVTATHRITWSYAGGSITSGAQTYAADGTGTTVGSWAVPSASLSALYQANTQSGTAVGTVTVETLTAGGTSVGSTTYAAYLTIPQDATTLPTISISTAPVYTDSIGTAWGTQHSGGYLQGHTDVSVTPTAAAKAGASVSSIIIGTPDGSAAGTSGSASRIPITSAPSTYTVTATVTDSRGFTATATATITVTACPVPAISAIGAARCDSGGTEDDEGLYALVTWTAGTAATEWTWAAYEAGTSTAVAGGTVTLQTPAGSGSGVIGGGLLDREKAYLITVTVEDAFGQTAGASAEIGTSLYTIHRMTGGKGVAFGKVSDRLGVEVSEDWPFYVHGQEILRLTVEAARPVGSVVLSLDDSWDPNAEWPWTQWGSLGTATIFGETVTAWARGG